MTISRRNLLRQIPTNESLRALGRAAASLGLGHLLESPEDAPGAVEAAGLALARKRSPSCWEDMTGGESEVKTLTEKRPGDERSGTA